MEWYIIVFVVIVFVITLGVIIDINLKYDVTKNNGELIVKFFKIPLIIVDLKVSGNAINFKKKSKQKPFQFIINLQNLKFIERLKENIVKRIYINKIETNSIISIENPALASLFSSGFNMLLEALKYKLVKFQNDAFINNNVITGFEENRLIFIANISLVISVMDLILALIKTVFEKGEKYGKQHR